MEISTLFACMVKEPQCPRRFNLEELSSSNNGERWFTEVDGDMDDYRLDDLIDNGQPPITSEAEIELWVGFVDHGSTIYELRVALVGAKEVYLALNGNFTSPNPRPGSIRRTKEWLFVYKFPSDITSFSFYTSPEEDGTVSINQFDISGCIIERKCPKPWSKVKFNYNQQDNFLITSSAGGNPWDVVKGAGVAGVYTEDSARFSIKAKSGGYFDVFQFIVKTKGVDTIILGDFIAEYSDPDSWMKTTTKGDIFRVKELKVFIRKMYAAPEMKIKLMTFRMCTLMNDKK